MWRLTVIGIQTAMILDEEIRECAMDVGANLLAGLGRPKDPDDRDLGFLSQL